VYDFPNSENCGVPLLEEIARSFPMACPIALTNSLRIMDISAFFHHGGCGYVTWSVQPDDLHNAVRVVLRGELYIPQKWCANLFKNLYTVSDLPNPDALDTLSPRQNGILAGLERGESTRNIADLYCISLKTVETHCQQIMKKLGARSKGEIRIKSLLLKNIE